MGVFSRKPKPAFEPPELPMANVPDHRRASQAGPSARRPSMFPTIFRTPSVVQPEMDPVTGLPAFQGVQQSTFLGRKMSSAVVPAYARNKSLAIANKDKNPEHLRMGETDGQPHENISDAFYRAKLTLDQPSDGEEEEEEDVERQEFYERGVLPITRRSTAAVSNRSALSAKLGWDMGPPKGKARKGKTKAQIKTIKSKRKHHRSKRVMRELDQDLDTFNTYAQNGLTPLNRSTVTSRVPSRNPSVTSLPLSIDLHTPLAAHIGETYLPEDRLRSVPVGDGYDALDVMADHIFRIGVQKKKWFKAPRLGARRDEVATGVTIRAKTGLYRTFPVNYDALDEFEEAVCRLNPEVAIKIKSSIATNVIRTYIDPFPSATELIIDTDTRIQILDEIPHLARARKHQYAAFIRSEGVLVIWADHVESVIPAAEALEEALIQFIWRGEDENKRINAAMIAEEEEKEAAEAGSVKEEDLDPEDVELRKLKKSWRDRPTMLYAPMSDGLSIIVTMTIIALGLRTLVKEYKLDGGALRFLLFIFAPALFCVASFACMCLVGSIMQTFGPIRQVTQKSKYFSGIAPKRTMGELAHVTVQMPVYKESLEEVIMPTVESLKKAITTYERQGGSVSLLVCDDGLQLLSKEEADRRRAFYFDNNIAYVARPGHNVDGFIRKGRFKKAGNMNFANALSLRVEEIMDDLRPGVQAQLDPDHFWSDNDENQVYDQALQQALEEKQGKAWAAGNIRIGPIILIIDSDTRVPEDCFADAVSEMAESPEVAIIQHMSGVMQVANHFFENGVAHFTRGIQHAISYVCASGEVAPFVGHNAFIRWSALQECMFEDPDDGVRKIWSEDHVSEDFQIAVTLQIKGYIVRWATYSQGDFEEGVSLTCDDELNRWQKYAFGCSELIFHPIKQTFKKGPITPLFRRFLWSSIPIHSKFTICGYMFSYYAISCAWLLSVMNYFVVGFDLPLDGYYLPSWQVTLVCIVLFVGICNVAFITLRYRLKLPDCSRDAVNQIKWIPFFSIFFTGMSLPMSAALISHVVGYNMTWSTTIKTVEKSNFFLQLPIIWKRFYPQLIFFGLMVVAMIITSSSLMPSGYRVHNIEVWVPMGLITASHLLWPFALNPWFLSFSF